jgi:hypothetical protein
MAFVISDLDHRPDPEQGEAQVFLTLVRQPHGYCMKAVTNENRDIGRWVSDCPLAVATTAMLWLTQRPWEIRLSKDSIDVQRILDEVEGLVPRGRVHPQDALEALRRNFPEKPTESNITGARVELRQRIRPAISGPVAEPPPVARRRAPPPPPPPEMSPEEVEQARFVAALDKSLRRANAGIAAGRKPGAALRRLITEIGLDPAMLPSEIDTLNEDQLVHVRKGLTHQIRVLRSGKMEPILVRNQTAAMLGIDLDAPAEEDEIEDEELERELAEIDEELPEDAEDEEEEEDEAPAAPQVPAKIERRLRPLGRDEVPPDLDEEQQAQLESLSGDPALYEKMDRTRKRAEREHQRINAHVARRRAAQAAAPASAPAPAPVPAQVQAAPEEPKSRGGRKPRVVVTPPPEEDERDDGADQAASGE